MTKQKRHDHQSLSCNHIDWSGVSNDIIFRICLELPADTLVRFRWVCKYWFDLTSDPSFIKMHINHHQISKNPSILFPGPSEKRSVLQWDSNVDDDAYSIKQMGTPFIPMTNSEIIGCRSWNGLVCFLVQPFDICTDRFFCIWNPCTKEYKKIYGAPYDVFDRDHGYGFCYDDTIDDYKVISHTYKRWYENYDGLQKKVLVSTEVYTLGKGSWKSIRTDHENYHYRCHNVVFVNGALYCLMKHSEYSLKTVILSFDIAKEVYSEVPKPHDLFDLHIVDHYWMNSIKLRVLEGCLCVVGRAMTSTSEYCMKVWVMKDYDGVNYSWTQLFNLSIEDAFCWRFNPLRFWKNGEVLVAVNDKDDLVSYCRTNKKIIVGTNERAEKLLSGTRIKHEVTYIGSLASLQSGTFTSRQDKIIKAETERRRRRRRRKRKQGTRRG